MLVIHDLDSDAVRLRFLFVDVRITLFYFIIFCSRPNCFVKKKNCKDLKSVCQFFKHLKSTERA